MTKPPWHFISYWLLRVLMISYWYFSWYERILWNCCWWFWLLINITGYVSERLEIALYILFWVEWGKYDPKDFLCEWFKASYMHLLNNIMLCVICFIYVNYGLPYFFFRMFSIYLILCLCNAFLFSSRY